MGVIMFNFTLSEKTFISHIKSGWPDVIVNHEQRIFFQFLQYLSSQRSAPTLMTQNTFLSVANGIESYHWRLRFLQIMFVFGI